MKTLTRNWRDHRRTGTHKHTETVSRYFDRHGRLSQSEESKCLWTHDKDGITREFTKGYTVILFKMWYWSMYLWLLQFIKFYFINKFSEDLCEFCYQLFFIYWHFYIFRKFTITSFFCNLVNYKRKHWVSSLILGKTQTQHAGLVKFGVMLVLSFKWYTILGKKDLVTWSFDLLSYYTSIQ